MNEPMTFLDFFSGVGGFRKGFELCGMVCKGHCEIDKFADRSYRAIHDIQEDEWYGEDITKTEPNHLPRVNLWAGGFPCQIFKFYMPEDADDIGKRVKVI